VATGLPQALARLRPWPRTRRRSRAARAASAPHSGPTPPPPTPRSPAPLTCRDPPCAPHGPHLEGPGLRGLLYLCGRMPPAQVPLRLPGDASGAPPGSRALEPAPRAQDGGVHSGRGGACRVSCLSRNSPSPLAAPMAQHSLGGPPGSPALHAPPSAGPPQPSPSICSPLRKPNPRALVCRRPPLRIALVYLGWVRV